MTATPSAATGARPSGASLLGFAPERAVYSNLGPAALYEHAIRRGEGVLAEAGPFCAVTSPHTGRSPNDKFVVREPSATDQVWWGKVNQPLDPGQFDRLYADVLRHLNGQELFVRDLFAGADPAYRLPVRFVSPNAWHTLFVHNMFLRPTDADLAVLQAGLARAARTRAAGRPRRRTARSPARSSCSTSPGAWSSSAAPATPAR